MKYILGEEYEAMRLEAVKGSGRDYERRRKAELEKGAENG